jgi:type IV secretory pathway TraG/TraD family ATPase VirD4
VYCYDPANAVHSCQLNVLDSIRWGSPQAYGDAHRICHHLIVPQRDREPGPFDRPAVALLTGVVLHLHDLAAASFPHVVAWMQAPQRSQREKLEEMLHSANPHVASAARRVLDESDRYRSIVWDAALAPLQVFLDERPASHLALSVHELSGYR